MKSQLPGVVIQSISSHTDSRGWLTELFREDELPEGFNPAMGYISLTHSGIARGPHEHKDQTDLFVFLSGKFEVTLWENRAGLPQFKEIHTVGEANPCMVIVPPGVVHAYRNISSSDATVLNFPNRLYAGWGKKEPVDEIRHEDEESEFKL